MGGFLLDGNSPWFESYSITPSYNPKTRGFLSGGISFQVAEGRWILVFGAGANGTYTFDLCVFLAPFAPTLRY